MHPTKLLVGGGNVNCTKFSIKKTDFDKIFENCEAKSVYSSQIQIIWYRTNNAINCVNFRQLAGDLNIKY